MSQFVRQNGSHFFGLALLNQGIVDYNVLLPWQTKEIGVAVRASFAPVDNIQLGEGKLELRSQCLDRRLEFASFQWGELVEQRCDEDGPNSDHEHLETSAEEPQVVEKLLARLLDNGEEGSEDWRGQNNSKAEGLDSIRNEELRGLFVEAELLFEHKSVIYRGWQRQDLVDEGECQYEENRVRDFTGEPSGRKTEEQIASP